MNENNILNTRVDEEDAFIKKWKVIDEHVDPVYYRCFTKYVFLHNRCDILSGSICEHYIEPILNPVLYRMAYENKNIYGKMYPKEWLPCTYIRKIDGLFMDEDYNVLHKDYQDFISNHNNLQKFIVKPTVESRGGSSISLFRKIQDSYVDQNGCVFDFSDIDKQYQNNYIIQECVSQSDYMSQFNPTSVNTIRMAVYRSVKDNEPYVTNTIIRIGGMNKVVDNAHAGGRFCGIDSNGNLNKYVCDMYGRRFDYFNNISFKDSSFCIPNFEKIKEFAKNIVRRIPYHRLVALDIALDTYNNPVLIEFNIRGFSYWLYQLSGQVTLDGFTDEIIEYCLSQKDFSIVLKQWNLRNNYKYIL